ncbi:UDP-2,3-diacylglucosamine diphosphatase [Shewanella sp. AS16]|uniref:UDP-2,3-diacylglucosamine diphosphatase n=1 Tax=Shewanella sp. AS16 TaxID=2907625 RepID=UPI001F16711E|nr:UDP-2,3-diacylglucosamine diphosphatase [Shewanella sp. AS16]MCE9686413.1 UDP-2,3-diacylglucosamine diphosphatase [Shewanella sp. AS16]
MTLARTQDPTALFPPKTQRQDAGAGHAPGNKTTHYHALWLSDIHLGCKDCKAEFLLQLLAQTQAKHIYLVGDIIDFWALKRRIYWPESHNQVLQRLLQLASDGTRILYVPGNHDELLKPYADLKLWDIALAREYIHLTSSGKQLLMVHGDQFDSQVCVGRFYARLGDHLYDLLLFLNRKLHQVRGPLGYPYWSLASYIKLRVGKAQEAIRRYRQAVVDYARRQGVDGVICGHIHQPELSLQQELIYANDGDWIENCTLLAETNQGELQLLRWDEAIGTTRIVSAVTLAAPCAAPHDHKSMPTQATSTQEEVA